VVSAFALINNWFPLEGAVASFFVAVRRSSMRHVSPLEQFVADCCRVTIVLIWRSAPLSLPSFPLNYRQNVVAITNPPRLTDVNRWLIVALSFFGVIRGGDQIRWRSGGSGHSVFTQKYEKT
jgi:hypothetical protein